jgi:hypothetical protein
MIAHKPRIEISSPIDLSQPGWRAIRECRRKSGAFAWFMQCQEHRLDFQERCLSCGMAQDHNDDILREIAREMGWLFTEPAGDVPISRGRR